MTTDTAIASTRPITRSTRVLMGPFAVERWRVTLRKTGNSAPIDLRLAGRVPAEPASVEFVPANVLKYA